MKSAFFFSFASSISERPKLHDVHLPNEFCHDHFHNRLCRNGRAHPPQVALLHFVLHHSRPCSVGPLGLGQRGHLQTDWSHRFCRLQLRSSCGRRFWTVIHSNSMFRWSNTSFQGSDFVSQTEETSIWSEWQQEHQRPDQGNSRLLHALVGLGGIQHRLQLCSVA